MVSVMYTSLSEAFMEAMEVDAKDRFEKRKKREKESNIEKDLGNEQFKLGNYEKAIEYYTKVWAPILLYNT